MKKSKAFAFAVARTDGGGGNFTVVGTHCIFPFDKLTYCTILTTVEVRWAHQQTPV